jgi:hypothetical protein
MKTCYHTTGEPYINDCNRVLRLEVLGQAIRDLSDIQRHIVRQAIGWFRYSDVGNVEEGFTFEQIKADLDLSYGQLRYIENQVRNAESFTLTGSSAAEQDSDLCKKKARLVMLRVQKR